MKPGIILISDMLGSLVCITVLVIMDPYKNFVVLWIVTVFFGLFMSSIYATAYSLPGELSVSMDSRGAGMLIGMESRSLIFAVFAASGDMTLPVLGGALMNVIEYRALFWLIIIVSERVLFVEEQDIHCRFCCLWNGGVCQQEQEETTRV